MGSPASPRFPPRLNDGVSCATLVRMRDIEPADEYGALIPADAARAVNGLRVGMVYLASDLYARYVGVARDAGRSPAHPVAFGQELRRQGHLRVKKRVGGGGRGGRGEGRQVSAWQLT